MMPFCLSLGGGSQETLMLELLPSFTVATVTALGGALGTVKDGELFHLHADSETVEEGKNKS